MDKGTLYQFKNTINRTSVPSNPSTNMKAAEDFLLLVLHAHITAASETICKNGGYESVFHLADSVVKSYVRLKGTRNASKSTDSVFVHACDLLTLGLLWMGFHDAIREGDGDRVMLYWKFLLPVFKATGRKNYSIEAVSIQLQRRHLSERQAAQLLWSQFVNTRGRKGCNIPCDLYMEHLNWWLKTAIRNLHSNVHPASIVRAAKAIDVVHRVCNVFEHETQCKRESDRHSCPEFGKDYEIVLSVLQEAEVFSVYPGRKHFSFSKRKGIMDNFDKDKFVTWAKRHIH